MEVCSSTVRRCGDEEALKSLLEATEEIASAYRKAGENADVAGQILYDNIQDKTSTSSAHALNEKAKHEESSGPSCNKVPCNPYHDGKSKSQKQIWRVASAGTVSSVLGKDYIKPMAAANGSRVVSKPLKLDEHEFPMPKLQRDERNQAVKNDYLHKDMGDFLFKLLGNGFKLERDVIQQVLEKCGYDMQKSMEKLLDLSADTLEKGKKCVNHTEKLAASCGNSGETSCQKNLQQANYLADTNGNELSKQDRNHLQQKVLVSLFTGSEKYKSSRRTSKSNKRSIALGELVVEPLKDDPLEIEVDSVGVRQDNLIDEDEGKEDRYQQLREAVKEYRTTMKEYYKAAVTAFAQGDRDRASKLMDQGHFFCEKAREADEESSQEIFKTENTQSQEELVLDLHAHGAKEAIRLLKCHLSSFAGIPSFTYLKVILEKNDEDFTKGARRRSVMKLLEKDSIKWTEGGDTGIIQIHLETVKRKPLSFTKS